MSVARYLCESTPILISRLSTIKFFAIENIFVFVFVLAKIPRPKYCQTAVECKLARDARSKNLCYLSKMQMMECVPYFVISSQHFVHYFLLLFSACGKECRETFFLL